MTPPDSSFDILHERLLRSDLEHTLDHATALLAHAEARSVALEDYGIVLPPAVAGTPDDQAHLRAIAALYLAAELEGAMLVPAAELLAGLAATGGLPNQLGSTAEHTLEALWHGRNHRMTTAERQTLFSGLFGTTPAQEGVDGAMIDLCEALFKLTDDPTQAHLHATAGALADGLLRRTGTATMFVAKDVMGTIRTALALFQQTPVQAAFGARSTWAAVDAVAARYLHAQGAAEAHVSRGKDGVTVLAWLADVLPRVGQPGAPLASPDHPVVAAAADWLQVSLSLSERATPAAA